MTAAITVRGLCKRYGSVRAVDGVSFDVSTGEIFGILGPNGSGKTTTLECLQGLRHRDGGDITVLGLDPLRETEQLRRRIGSQLQESALPEHLRVGEALRLFAAATPGARAWEDLMQEWGLAEKRDASFASLSGGQRQRLFVALALVSDPEVVFLDEMTTGLDPEARHVAWDLVERIRGRGTTVVLVTHFMDEAERLCDRIGVLVRGRLVDIDTPAGVVARHGGSVRASFTSGDADLAWLSRVDHVASVARRDGRIHVDGDAHMITHLGSALLQHDLDPTDLRVVQPSLEDAYLRLVRSDEEAGHARAG